MSFASVPRRLGNLLRQPQYRVRLFVFLLLFILMIILAYSQPSPFWQNILSEFALTFGAVAFLQIIWDILGGDPLEVKFERIQESMASTQDLNYMGIERLWLNRREWQGDLAQQGKDGYRAWFERIRSAQCVDIASDSFWWSWLENDLFCDMLSERVRSSKGCIRIIILKPDSPALKQRAYDVAYSVARFNVESEDSLDRLKKILKENPNQSCIQVRVSSKGIPYCQLIRADDRMLVSLYLGCMSGSASSPAIQLREQAHETYFGTCKRYFEGLWSQGEEWRPVVGEG